jgi:hypothetical protein
MEKKQKVLIELPIETYEYWKEHPYEYVLAEAIKNCIPLSNSEADTDFPPQTHGFNRGTRQFLVN